MKVALENAGAQRGLLLLDRNGKFYMEAESMPGKENVLRSVELDSYKDISQSIVQYVRRAQEAVVLDNAAESGSFVQDEYISKNKVRSVLCMPILKQKSLKVYCI